MDMVDFPALPTSSKGARGEASPNSGFFSFSKVHNPRSDKNGVVGDRSGVAKVSGVDPKPNLLDVLDLVTVPSGFGADSSVVKDLVVENEMLHKLLAEKSVPVLGSAWKDKVGCDTVERVNLEFIPPQVVNDRIVVSPPVEVEEQGLDRWKYCIVGHFLDKRLPFKTVKNIIMNIWARFGISDVLANDNGFFFFVFTHDGDLHRVLDAGPWLILGKMLVLKQWKPHVALVKEQLQTVPIWAQFYNVLFEYWTANGLSYVASSVGKPSYSDEMTRKCKRMNYAKVCVEVNLESTLPTSFDLLCPNGDVEVVDVKYPWLPLKCMRCKAFGHSEAHCPSRPMQMPGVVTEQGAGTAVPINNGPKWRPKPVPVDMPSSSAGTLDVIDPGIVVTPSRREGLMRASPANSLMPAVVSKSVVKWSRISICDAAAIERVVAQYAKDPNLKNTTLEKLGGGGWFLISHQRMT